MAGNGRASRQTMSRRARDVLASPPCMRPDAPAFDGGSGRLRNATARHGRKSP